VWNICGDMGGRMRERYVEKNFLRGLGEFEFRREKGKYMENEGYSRKSS
jgi:hypothetical protein